MKKLFGLIVFVFVFGLYLHSGYNTIPPYRDSGDLITSAYTLGIAHPPGYPLYINLGKIWTLVAPLGNIAYRMNLISILLAAVSISLLFWLFANSNHVFIGLIVAGFLAFSSSVWSLSQVSEMYTLNLLIATLIVCLAIIPSTFSRSYYLIAFLLGLGMGNHYSIILVLPAILIYYWTVIPKEKKYLTQWLNLGLFFVMGLTINLFLPVRSLTDPLINWGEPHSLRNLWRVLTRADYGGLRLHPEQSYVTLTINSAFNQMVWYLKNLIQQFGFIGFLIGASAMVLTFRNRYWWFLILGLLFTGPAFVLFSNLPINELSSWAILEPHLVLPNLFFGLFIGFGIKRIVSYQNFGKLSRIVFYIIITIGVINVFAVHCNQYFRRNDFFAYDYGKNILRSLPKHSLLFNPDDSTAFIVSYLQNCTHQRNDIRPIVYFRTRWGYEQLKRRYPENLPPREVNSADELVSVLLEHNRDNWPIYTDLPQKIPAGHKYLAQGLVYSIYHNQKPEKVFSQGRVLFENIYVYRGKYRISQCYSPDFFSRQILSYYSAGHNNLGLGYQHIKDYFSAESEYFNALNIDPDLSESYNNLGILYYLQKKWEQSIHSFSESLKHKYDASVLFNQGLVYKTKGDLSEAEKIFNQISVSYPAALNEIGLFQLSRGEIQSAINSWQKLLTKQPDYLPAVYNLGMGYEKLGDNQKAIKFYELYLTRITDPNEIMELKSIINRLQKQIK